MNNNVRANRERHDRRIFIVRHGPTILRPKYNKASSAIVPVKVIVYNIYYKFI